MKIKNKRKYYYIDYNGDRIGPKCIDALYFLFITGKLTQSTMVESGRDLLPYSEILDSHETATLHHKNSYRKKSGEDYESAIRFEETQPIAGERSKKFPPPAKKQKQEPNLPKTPQETDKVSPDSNKTSYKISSKGKKKKAENRRILSKKRESINPSSSQLQNKSRFSPFFQTLTALSIIGVAFSIFIFFWMYSWPDLSDSTVLDEILNDNQTINANRLSTDNSEGGEGRLYASWRQRLGESVFFPSKSYFSGWAFEGQRSKLFYFDDGKKEGPFVELYSNKKIMTKGTYDNGKLAEAKVWKPNGELCPNSNVKDGNGVLVEYNGVGGQRFRTTYQNGERVKD